MKYKLFKVRVGGKEDAPLFIDWLSGIEPPFHFQINELAVNTIETAEERAFWVAGFQTLID